MGSPDCPHLCLQPEELTHALEISNIVFTSMFALEMLLKLLACGPLGYIRNPYNIFDGIIVVIRWVPPRLPMPQGPGKLHCLAKNPPVEQNPEHRRKC